MNLKSLRAHGFNESSLVQFPEYGVHVATAVAPAEILGGENRRLRFDVCERRKCATRFGAERANAPEENASDGDVLVRLVGELRHLRAEVHLRGLELGHQFREIHKVPQQFLRRAGSPHMLIDHPARYLQREGEPVHRHDEILALYRTIID